MNIRSLIHHDDPYEGFDADAYPADVLGWNDHSAMFSQLARDATLIVEVGSWLGRSAITIADACPSAHIICIDTWLGAAEMWRDHNDPERFGQLRLKNGYPTIYYHFLANVVRAEKQDRITPFPLPSAIALRMIGKWCISPDLIYIDASHDFPDVMDDISAAMRLHPRVLCGDDYRHWPGVREAVDRLLPSANKNEDGFWWQCGIA